MKKLIIAFTAGLVAIAVNAASINWLATSGYLFDGATSPNKLTSGTAYLVLSTYSQSELVTEFVKTDGNAATTLATLQGKKLESGELVNIGSGEIASAKIAEGKGETTFTEPITSYFVIFNDKMMYISDTAVSDYDTMMSEHTIMFSSVTSSSKKTIDANKGYTSAGWYAVPEPTSGLLLLIGMAGLALKRKRA